MLLVLKRNKVLKVVDIRMCGLGILKQVLLDVYLDEGIFLFDIFQIIHEIRLGHLVFQVMDVTLFATHYQIQRKHNDYHCNPKVGLRVRYDNRDDHSGPAE